MGINIKKMKVLTAYIIFFILQNLFLCIILNQKFEIWIKFLSVFSVFLFLIDTIFFIILGKKIFSVGYIFVALSFLFHMGQVILHAFFKDYNYISADFIKIYPEQLTKSALLFSLNIIQIVTFFILLSTYSKIKRERMNSKFNKISNTQLKLVGWIMCIITVPMKFKYIKAAIDIVQDETYVSSTVEGFSGVYIQISNFCIIAFVILLFAYSYNKVMQKIILFSSCLFFVWSMLSGGRIYGVISILILLLCYIRINDIKINFISITVMCFFMVVFLQLITTISFIRTTHEFNIPNLIQYAFNPSNNFLLKMLDEFGGTVGTVIFTFDEVPRYLDFHNGQSYIKAWMLVGFNINGILNQISKEISYTLLFSNRFHLGGSYIGELYYNFGFFSYAFAPLVGLFIGKISEMSDYCLENKLVIEFAVLVMPVYGAISWVRGYFDSFTRSFVWGTVFILFFYFVCRRIKISDLKRKLIGI